MSKFTEYLEGSKENTKLINSKEEGQKINNNLLKHYNIEIEKAHRIVVDLIKKIENEIADVAMPSTVSLKRRLSELKKLSDLI